MTSTERAAYRQGRRDGVRAAEARIELRTTFMESVNARLIEALVPDLPDDKARAVELAAREIELL